MKGGSPYKNTLVFELKYSKIYSKCKCNAHMAVWCLRSNDMSLARVQFRPGIQPNGSILTVLGI